MALNLKDKFSIIPKITLLLPILCIIEVGLAQDKVQAVVNFDHKLQEWDGFGVNYVETSQTPDYSWFPQDYGGFSLLNEADRQHILEMIFGEEGLRPSVAKMFLEPFHQETPESEFDHTTSTKWMRYFIRQGLERANKRNDEIKIITTLYGPPAWATKQKFVRGKDLDPTMKEELANYIIDWVKYCRDVEGFNIRYISVHNEGERKQRWSGKGECEITCDGPNWHRGHDYNMWWSPEQVTDFLSFMPPMIKSAGLEDVKMTPGETTFLARFEPFAKAIIENEKALENVGLITSHGFRGNNPKYESIDLLRSHKPGLHTWITSMALGKDWEYNVDFLSQIYNHIYLSKVNAIIPWTISLYQKQWRGGAWNGTAFWINEDGSYEVRYSYFLYKHVCPIGQEGMVVAETSTDDPTVKIIAFNSNGTQNPNAFTVINESDSTKIINVSVKGGDTGLYTRYRTNGKDEHYKKLDDIEITNKSINYEAPAQSASTFISK